MIWKLRFRKRVDYHIGNFLLFSQTHETCYKILEMNDCVKKKFNGAYIKPNCKSLTMAPSFTLILIFLVLVELRFYL